MIQGPIRVKLELFDLTKSDKEEKRLVEKERHLNFFHIMVIIFPVSVERSFRNLMNLAFLTNVQGLCYQLLYMLFMTITSRIPSKPNLPEK